MRRLVLTSRRGPEAEGATELVAELAELGCAARGGRLRRRRSRAGGGAALRTCRSPASSTRPGVLDDGTIASLDAERLRAVMAPKVDGASHLHELTADRELSFFVLFSSAAAALGAPGPGQLRRRQRLPGRAGASPPGARPGRHVARLGSVAAGRRDGRRGRRRPPGPLRHRAAVRGAGRWRCSTSASPRRTPSSCRSAST